tara:strand:+ start:371 stop:859 length:489 start_codon:yes stop_codon:yes gene_type:complete
MPELVEANEIMFTPFEPKLQNRFILTIDGVPSYTIKASGRPQIEFEEVELRHMNVSRYVAGKGTWQPLEITLYDPIVPSSAQAVMEWIRLSHESVTGRDGYADFYKKDVVINTLGPVGDKIEEWQLKGAFIQAANFGELSFENVAPVEISCTLRYDYAILQF